MMADAPRYNPFQPLVAPNIQAPNTGPQSQNFAAARDEMNLNPQEQALYQMHLSNLYGAGGVDNMGGSRSTLYQTVEPHNGRFYNIPTVWNGHIESQKWVDPNDQSRVFDVANQQALQNVQNAGWQNFPSYATGDQADSRYQKMHDYMERDTADYLGNRQQQPTSLADLAKFFR
jgi:hypothetical protein